MQLRIAKYKNEVTMEEIKDYRDRAGCGMREAKSFLQAEITQLEQYIEGEWVAVPTVRLTRE